MLKYARSNCICVLSNRLLILRLAVWIPKQINILIIFIFNVIDRSMGATPTSNNNHFVEKHHPADCESCYAEPPEPLTDTTNIQQSSLFFADGERSIDYVLVWRAVDEAAQEDLNCTKRAIFEDNLVNEGLELERDSIDQIHFTKVHTPIEVLRRYAEILKLRMPMKEVTILTVTHFWSRFMLHFNFFSWKLFYFQSLCFIKEQNRFSRFSNAALFIYSKVSRKIPISNRFVFLNLSKWDATEWSSFSDWSFCVNYAFMCDVYAVCLVFCCNLVVNLECYTLYLIHFGLLFF